MRLLVTLFYAGIAAMGLLLLESTELAGRQYDALIALDSPGEAASRASKSALESLTFGLYKGAREARDERRALTEALEETEARVRALALGLLALTALSLALGAWRWRRAAHRRRARTRLALHLCGCAAVFLVIGVLAPILTIVARQDVAVLGRVVLSHETKSFVGTIDGLLASGDWLVAALLALFSLVVPASKLGLCALALLCQAGERLEGLAARTHGLLHHLGRWSMTDVFVVAVLVAFFGTSKSDATEAWVGTGLYFFAAHTGLALLASILAPRPPATPAAPAGRLAGQPAPHAPAKAGPESPDRPAGR